MVQKYRGINIANVLKSFGETRELKAAFWRIDPARDEEIARNAPKVSQMNR
jgi:hypothetical protein